MMISGAVLGATGLFMVLHKKLRRENYFIIGLACLFEASAYVSWGSKYLPCAYDRAIIKMLVAQE